MRNTDTLANTLVDLDTDTLAGMDAVADMDTWWIRIPWRPVSRYPQAGNLADICRYPSPAGWRLSRRDGYPDIPHPAESSNVMY